VEDLTDSRRVALSAHPDAGGSALRFRRCVSALRLVAGAAMEAPWEAVGRRRKPLEEGDFTMKNNVSHGLTMKYGIFTKKNGSQTMRTGVFTMKNEVFTIKHGVLTTKNGDYHQNRDFPDKYSDCGSHSFASTPSSYRGCIKLLKIHLKKITLSGITKHHFTSFCLVLKVLTQKNIWIFPRFFHVFSTFFPRFFHVFSTSSVVFGAFNGPRHRRRRPGQRRRCRRRCSAWSARCGAWSGPSGGRRWSRCRRRRRWWMY